MENQTKINLNYRKIQLKIKKNQNQPKLIKKPKSKSKPIKKVIPNRNEK